MQQFKILKKDENKRLDIFLKEQYPDMSRSFLQKQIKEGNVKINDKIVSVHHFLKEGDIIKISNFKSQISNKKEEAQLRGQVSISKILNIIFETEDYLVINKPCGLIVHPSELEEKNTLAHILLEKYPEMKNVGESTERPGIVHRLDKDVSGIMVVAKTQKMFTHLKKQFQERKVNKEYIALVYGIVHKSEGVIDFPIGRSKVIRTKMAARPLNQGGREAITEFEVLKNLSRWTLLLVKIKTGRMHQIRVHLNAYGHPVVGDNVYKPKKLKPTIKFGKRVMLHSWKLGFQDLDGDWKGFEAALPDGFKQIIGK